MDDRRKAIVALALRMTAAMLVGDADAETAVDRQARKTLSALELDAYNLYCEALQDWVSFKG